MPRRRFPATVADLPPLPIFSPLFNDKLGFHSEGYIDYLDGYDDYAEGPDSYDGDYAEEEEDDYYAWNLGYDTGDFEESDSDEIGYSELCYDCEDDLPPPPPEPQRSDRFWFEDGNIVIQVDLTIYKLYKGILMRQSEYLESEISEYLRVRTLLGETDSESDPYQLYSLSNYEVDLLLSYMFPEDYSSQNDFVASEWAAIAGASSKLQIKSVRAAAIANIMKLSGPLDLFNLGDSYQLIDCVLEGLRLLCSREESLSLEEGEKLGLGTVIAIAHGRDLLSRGCKWSEVVGRVVTAYYPVPGKVTLEQQARNLGLD